MEKSATPGKLLSLLHLGYSVRNRDATMDFYYGAMEAAAVKTQRSDAPYIGQVNGVTGAVADLAFIDCAENRPMVELLQFIKPLDAVRRHRPGEHAYSQIGYRTADIGACYERMRAKGLEPPGPVATVDYGCAKGREAFLLRDPEGMLVRVAQDEHVRKGQGGIIDHDHIVLSVPSLDETAPVFRDLLSCEVTIEDAAGSGYLASYCEKPVSRVAVCRSRLEPYAVELWETGGTGGVENTYISAAGSVHLCYRCQGMDNLYENFRAAGMRFVNKPVLVTKGVNQGSKAIFFHAPGYLWIELICRKDDL